jgi:tetratricopeptide (TPR) repeat protein
MARKATKAGGSLRKPPQALLAALERVTEAIERPLQRAQMRCFDAMEAAAGSTRLGRAADALEISPLAADAWGMLAGAAPEGSPLALLLWRQAVAAGILAIGPEALVLEPGDYWGVLETRPYMRARCGLALELWRQGERAAAIAEVEDMLRLNPNDNQGMRYALLDWLLAEGRDAEAAALQARYAEDGSAAWAYGAALLAFRREGAGGAADTALGAAIEANPHVAAVMLGRQNPAGDAGAYSHGSPEEAAWVAPGALPAWTATEGALGWLAARSGDAAPPPRRGRKPRAAP